ncbi:nicotinamide/nicotinic acid mononucleotide adenylyltransferase 3-like [Lethenteron reissneri]|uniref:nicotinamide/nicotinic acid mononucleotide adenylyltransferase 3-like n=1 Tax=Lethenteron reissneri TaxID=7753 RepID=UPI002AB7DAA8|nr:nicotinamide/nicotinic acid mononucleotide adenylyltransferase 3-like [Lethenteron reissneri]
MLAGARMGPPVPVVLLSCGSFNPITNMHLRMFELARDHLQATGQYRVVQGLLSPVGDEYGKPGLVATAHRMAMVQKAVATSGWLSADPWESEQGSWLETVKILRHHHNRILEEGIVLGKAATSGVTTTKQEDLVDGSHPRGAKRKQKWESGGCVGKRVKTVTGDEHTGSDSVEQQQQAESAVVVTEPTGGETALAGQPRVMLLCGADLLKSFQVPGLWDLADVAEIVGRFGIVCVSRFGYDCPKIIYESDLLWKHRNSIHLVQEWVTTELSSTHVRRALRRGASVRYLVPDTVAEYISRHGLYQSDEEEGKDRFALLAPLARLRQDADGAAETTADVANDNAVAETTNRTAGTASVTVTGVTVAGVAVAALK